MTTDLPDASWPVTIRRGTLIGASSRRFSQPRSMIDVVVSAATGEAAPASSPNKRRIPSGRADEPVIRRHD
jgi:hypothetical protein